MCNRRCAKRRSRGEFLELAVSREIPGRLAARAAGGMAMESRPLSAGRLVERASAIMGTTNMTPARTAAANQCLPTLFHVRIREISVRGKAPTSVAAGRARRLPAAARTR